MVGVMAMLVVVVVVVEVVEVVEVASRPRGCQGPPRWCLWRV